MLKGMDLIFHGRKQSHVTSMRLLNGSFSNLNLHDLNPRNYGTSKISIDFNIHLNLVFQMILFTVIAIIPN